MFAIKVIRFVVFLLAICAGTNAKTDLIPRIVYGADAYAGQFPWYAQLDIFESDDFSDPAFASCGGSVIDPQHILTAGHCLAAASSADLIRVTLGVWDIFNETNQQVFYGQTMETDHYRYENVHNDLGILTLNDYIKYSDYIQPIQLDCSGTDWFTPVQVAGRGTTSDNSFALPDHVKYANMTTIPNWKCSLEYHRILGPSKICADGGSMRQNVCFGDSGSAMVKYVDGVQVQSGIVSAGSGPSCQVGSPALFTRISHFIPWLRRHADIQCNYHRHKLFGIF